MYQPSKNRVFNIIAVGGFLLGGLLSGCSLTPQYHRPAAPISTDWPDQAGVGLVPKTGVSIVGMNWSDFVLEPDMRRLVEAALANNRDLREAVLNIEAARAQYRIERTDQFPAVDGLAGSTRQRTSANSSGTENSFTQSTRSIGFGLSAFELDLFNRVRNLSDAALQDYLATEQTARSVRISLIAEVVQAYLERAGTQERYDLTLQTLETRKTSLTLIEKQRTVGTASEMDYLEALGLLQQAQADLQAVTRELAQAENFLVLLTGVAAENLPRISRIGQPLLQERLAPDLPSSLLERRPDIIAAEHTLMARNANIGAARAAFYPRISITGQYGAISTDFVDLFESGSLGWKFNPQLVLPIFDGGSNQANLDLAEVRKDIAIAQYEKTIQTAFQEVADALSSRDTLIKEEQARTSLARTSAKSLKLSKARYRHGMDSHLRYLDAQRSDFSNQINLISARTQRQTSLVTLFKALGGGWDVKPVAVQLKSEYVSENS